MAADKSPACSACSPCARSSRAAIWPPRPGSKRDGVAREVLDGRGDGVPRVVVCRSNVLGDPTAVVDIDDIGAILGESTPARVEDKASGLLEVEALGLELKEGDGVADDRAADCYAFGECARGNDEPVAPDPQRATVGSERTTVRKGRAPGTGGERLRWAIGVVVGVSRGA